MKKATERQKRVMKILDEELKKNPKATEAELQAAVNKELNGEKQ